MRPDERSRDYLHSLDGWRALAVCLVLVDHAQRLPGPFSHLQGGGGLGVHIFFAISGLLICTRLMEEEARFGNISLRSFYIRRAFRILPASMLYLCVLALLGALTVVPFERSSWLSALFFYRNYYTCWHGVSAAGWFTSHFWSLSVEEHFYFLLPSLLVFFPRSRELVLGILIALSMGWAFYFIAENPDPSQTIWTSRSEFSLLSLLAPALYAIAIRREHRKALATRLLPPWLGLLLGALCVTRFVHPFPTMADDALWSLILKSFLFPLMLLSTVLHPSSLITRTLDFAPLRFIGRISYSLYLWQALFLTRSFTYPHYSIHRLQHPVVGIACVFTCAIASYTVVETPAIAFGRRFTTHRLPVHPAAGTNHASGLQADLHPGGNIVLRP